MILAQFRELAAFTQFGSDLDEGTLKQLNRGEKMVELLKQGQYVPMDVTSQVLIIWAGTKGHLDDVPTPELGRFESEFTAFCDEKYPDLRHNLDKDHKISDAIEAELVKAIEEFKSTFKTETEA